MATAGALVGASIAGLAYKLSGQNYTVTFAMATIPAAMALVLTWSVRARIQPLNQTREPERGPPMPGSPTGITALGGYLQDGLVFKAQSRRRP